MLTYSFEERGERTLYEFLYESIRRDILSGVLMAEEKLPSKRAFAKHLGISTITVETAYAQLQMEGYIYALPRRGFFVSDLSDAAQYLAGRSFPEDGQHPEQTEPTDTGRLPVQSTDRSGCICSAGTGPTDTGRALEPDRGAECGGKGPEGVTKYPVDFSSNQTRADSFPFSSWAKLSRKVLSQQKEQLMQNPPTQGLLELREAIAAHLRAFRGIQAEAGNIVVGAGTEYLYGLLIQLLGIDKVYASENPGYRKVPQVFAAYQVRSVLIGLDADGLNMEQLERLDPEVVHVTPSHHFPTGITMPVKRRYELLSWAAGREGRYLIEDDYDSELRMSGRPLPALCSMDTEGRVIYMNTFTKTLSSTVRVSYMVLPGRLMERFHREMGFYSCTVSTFEQYTLAHFIGQGYFEKHLNRMRNSGRRKRDLLLDQIQKSGLGDIAQIHEEHAGLHFLMEIALSVPEEEFLERLEAKGIRLAPMSQYYFEKTQEETAPRRPGWGSVFVINYSSVKEEYIEGAMRCICRAAKGEDGRETLLSAFS